MSGYIFSIWEQEMLRLSRGGTGMELLRDSGRLRSPEGLHFTDDSFLDLGIRDLGRRGSAPVERLHFAFSAVEREIMPGMNPIERFCINDKSSLRFYSSE
jgi:hypothetical protein